MRQSFGAGDILDDTCLQNVNQVPGEKIDIPYNQRLVKTFVIRVPDLGGVSIFLGFSGYFGLFFLDTV